MKLDHMRRFQPDDEVDAVVIGTGAGGAPLLARLAKAGCRVVALEAGRAWAPRDHVADEVEAADLYWLGERLSGGETPEAFGGNNSGIGVGGSTLHWGAFVPRPDPRDLRLATEHGVGADWPLTLDELRPYLVEAERVIGVSGPGDYPWDPGRTYAFGPVARNAPARAMQAGCDALGIRATDAPAAVLSRDIVQPDGPARQACVNCGHCHQGCRNGAKASMDLTFLPAAVAAGAEIRPGCFAHGLERDRTGRITAVVYRQDGRDVRQKCRSVVLSAGAVETPRLLLHTGVGNASGQVGRNYMAHVATQVWGTFADEMRCWRGYPSSLITEDFVRPDAAAFAGGYIVQSLGVLPVTLFNGAARVGGFEGQGLVDYIDTYARLAGIGINGECLPADGNRLELSDERDETGVPKPRITFSYGANETAIHKHAEENLTRIWKAAGARQIWTLHRSAHTIGTCRMGRTDATAVVDPVGRSFEVDNLWICDNSVFPSSLAANPALTIMALSLRTADAMLAGRG